MKKCLRVLMGGLLMAMPMQAIQAAVFVDDFNSAASSANYNVVQSSADNKATFGWDYSALGIPSAPNTTDSSTFGLKLESNIESAQVTGITLHTLQSFSGNYRVTFDAWMNANGPFPAGGTGSTEFLTAGVGGNGSAVNVATAGTSGSGGWTAVSGEGGSTRDYRMFKDTAEQLPASGQFNAPSGNSSDPYYAGFGGIDVGTLPQNALAPATQVGVTGAGSFGFEWHEVSLLVNPTGGTGGAASVSWSIDGLQIGTLDAGLAAFNTDGRVTIGYTDIFTSVSDNAPFSFGLVDNLSVTAVPEPASGLCLLGFGLAMVRRRRA